MKSVLVTGATGFLGEHVVHQLAARGHSVTAHGRRLSPFGPIEYVQGDLADETSALGIFGSRHWDAVVDLAGPVTGGSEDAVTGREVVAAHVRIALHLRRFAARSRIVHASSMTVYGLPEALPVREDHRRAPMHLYGLAKMLAEDVLLVDPALDVWIARLPGLFSEKRATGALYHFCRAARQGQPVKVTAPVPTPWEILHVEDAARALVAMVDAPATRGGAINVGYGEPIELVSIARKIAALAGTGAAVQAADVTHPVFQLDIRGARELIGWAPPSLDATLARLYTAYGAS